MTQKRKLYFGLMLNAAKQRASEEAVNTQIRLIKQNIGKAGLSLEDIGTTEEELDELRKKGCKNFAIHFIGLARERVLGESVIDTIDIIRKNAKEAGVSLEEIGTSEEELKKLEMESEKFRKKEEK